MYIVKNQSNRIALTLSEKATATDSEWLIEMVNGTAGQYTKKIFAVTDISQFPERANIFYVTENATEDLYHATVSLSPTGQWSYTVYEMAPSSPRNLDIEDALSIVETGMAKVYSTTENTKVFFDTDEDKSNPVFEG